MSEEEEEEPEEDITDVQEGVCVKFCSLLLLFFFLSYQCFLVPRTVLSQ